MSSADVRDEVRARYARATQSVTDPEGRTALQMLDGDSCCAPAQAASATSAGDNVSCCGGKEVDVAFGAGLYSAAEQGELPAEAVAASLGCGNPMMVPNCVLARRCWTWGLVAASTCCCPPVGSVRVASPTGST